MQSIRIVHLSITTKIISLFLTALIILSFVPIVLCEIALVCNVLENRNVIGSFFAFLCLGFILIFGLIVCYKILNCTFKKYLISCTGVQVQSLFKKQYAPWTAFTQVSVESIFIVKSDKKIENKVVCFVPKKAFGNSRRNRDFGIICIKYDEKILSSLQSLCPLEISDHSDFSGGEIEQIEISDLLFYRTAEEKCDATIDFVGHVSADCVKIFNKTILKQNLIQLSVIFLTIIILSISVNWYMILFLLPFTLTGLSIMGTEQSELLPHRIRIDVDSKKIIYNFQEMKRVHSFKEVKKVIDYGFCYHFVFKKSDPYFVCQKSLITQGNLEKFEALFKEKIVRRF